jgi:hypothetical protein
VDEANPTGHSETHTPSKLTPKQLLQWNWSVAPPSCRQPSAPHSGLHGRHVVSCTPAHPPSFSVPVGHVEHGTHTPSSA